MCLVGCKKKIPEGISNEMFETGQDAMEITEKFLNEDVNQCHLLNENSDIMSEFFFSTSNPNFLIIT